MSFKSSVTFVTAELLKLFYSQKVLS